MIETPLPKDFICGIQGVKPSPYRQLLFEKDRFGLPSLQISTLMPTSSGGYCLYENSTFHLLLFDRELHFTTKSQLPVSMRTAQSGYSLAEFQGLFYCADFISGQIAVLRPDASIDRVLDVRDRLSPMSMTANGNRLFVSGIHPDGHDIQVLRLGKDGKGWEPVLTDLYLDMFKGKTETLWARNALVPFGRDGLMLGFQFGNTLIQINTAGEILNWQLMDAFYPRFEEDQDGAVFPAGYAATAFSEGPGQTLLIATCDQVRRVCSRVLQMNASLDRVISEWEAPFHLWQIKYFPHLQLLAFLGPGQVVFYKTE